MAGRIAEDEHIRQKLAPELDAEFVSDQPITRLFRSELRPASSKLGNIEAPLPISRSRSAQLLARIHTLVVPAEENPQSFDRPPVRRHYTTDGWPKHERAKPRIGLFEPQDDAINDGAGPDQYRTQYGQQQCQPGNSRTGNRGRTNVQVEPRDETPSFPKDLLSQIRVIPASTS